MSTLPPRRYCDQAATSWPKPPEVLAAWHRAAAELGVAVLGELPVLASVSESGDAGVPLVLRHSGRADLSPGEREWTATLDGVAERVLG